MATIVEKLKYYFIGLPAASSLTGTETVPIIQGGANVAASTQAIANLGGGALYKVYTALLSQTGTNAPNVDNLYANTIGNIVWTRFNVGSYRGTLNGAFTQNKTLCLPFGSVATGFMFQVVSGNSIGYVQISVGGADTNDILIQTYSDLVYTLVEWSSIGGSFSFEIRVYP